MSELEQLNQSQAAQRMTLAEWRASRLHELTLPSGLTVKVRDVPLQDLAMMGKIPNALMEFMLTNDKKQKDGASDAKPDLEMVAEMMQKNAPDFTIMLNEMVKFTMMEPKVADQADEEHLAVDELLFDDKMAIFNYQNREVVRLQSFREGEPDKDAPDSRSIWPTPEQTAELEDRLGQISAR
jgi:hypothetical protein